MQTRRDFVVQTAGALSVMALVPQFVPIARAAGEPVGVALIGSGRQGRAILGELQKMESVKILGICDKEESRMNSGVKRVQGAEGFTDHKAMLEKLTGVKAVIIATPTHLHRQIVVDCLAAGKHVYLEMPMAHTVEDCRAIAEAAAKSTNLVFHAGLEGRSNPIYKLARTFFRSDAVRDVVAVEAQHYQKTSWKFPASDPSREKEVNWRLDPEVSLGLAGEMGVHQFDVAFWYLDQLPTAVNGGGAIRLHQDGRTMPDTIHCGLRFEKGVHMNYAASLANSFQGRHEVLRGSNAAIKLAWSAGWMFKEADAPTQGWEVYANKQVFHNEDGITLIADATKLASQGKLKEGVGLPNPSLYYALGDFVASVSEGKPSVCDAAVGARASIVAILAAQAVAKDTEVKIDPELLKV